MRVLVGVLGGLAAALAFLVGAVSLTRVAGDYLGFPPGLEWTFTGAVDIAGIAGGVMWTAFSGPVRAIGRPMNLVCTLVSGVSVGLDHATHAGRALRDPNANLALPGTDNVWPVVAFIAGVFIPALATWILHALSVIADTRQDRHTASGGDRHPATPTAASDRQETHVVIAGGPPRPPAQDRHPATARTASPDRQPGRQVAAAALPAPSRASARVGFPGPRADWMTDALLSAVVTSMRAARAAKRSYGRPRLMADHDLTKHRAITVMGFIAKHDLLRVSA